MKNFLLVISILLINFFAYSEVTYESLFKNYQLTDNEYQKLLIQLKNQEINYQQVLLENGISVNFSTGNIAFTFLENETKLTVSPEVQVLAPNLNNSSIVVTVPETYTLGSSDSNTVSISDSSILFSTDIFSSFNKTRELEIKKAYRQVIQAKRTADLRQLSVKNDFANELRNLLVSNQDVIQADKDYIDKFNEFKLIQAKGYSLESAKYRTAKLNLESSKKKLEAKKRIYSSSLYLFEKKTNSKNLELNFSIPDVALVSTDKFSKKDYLKIEESEWNSDLNAFTRTIDNTQSLSVQGGYGLSFDGSEISNVGKAGLTWKKDGIKISALVNIPLDDKTNSGVSVNIGWDPTVGKTNKLTDLQNKNQIKIDELDLIVQSDSYDDTILSQKEKINNLEWELLQTIEECNVYEQLFIDMQEWYKQGLVSESEFREAKVNYENAKNNLALCKLDRIILNNTFLAMFNPEKIDEFLVEGNSDEK